MGRLSNRVANYTGKGKGCSTAMEAFYQQENCYNTLFDLRCEKKKSWGTDWYDYARYGHYAEARKILINRPACLAKTVALQCIEDLEWLKEEMVHLEKKVGV